MSGKKGYRSRRRSKQAQSGLSVPIPAILGPNWNHVSKLPGYLAKRAKHTFRFLRDADVSQAVIDGLTQEFDARFLTLRECDVNVREDEAVYKAGRKHRAIVLTHNYHHFLHGATCPLHECFGIFAITAANDGTVAPAVSAMMGAFVREVGLHVPWDWWAHTKVGFGVQSCAIHRHEEGHAVRRDLRVYDPNARMFWKLR
jgi:hypothetical protein